MASSDAKLGQDIHQHLVDRGIETPMTTGTFDRPFREEMVRERSQMESHVAGILSGLNMDLNDDSIKETPHRVAKMYRDEVFWGLDYRYFPRIMTIENKMNYDELIIEKDVEIQSCCEHHLQPFIGHAHIAYLPKDKVVGLSKLNRVAEFFARRPQVQERLTLQIAQTLQYVLETDTVAVILTAEHFCVKLRGVRDCGSSTATSYMGGEFRTNPSLKQEFMQVAYGKA